MLLCPCNVVTSSWFAITGVLTKEIIVSCEAAASLAPLGLYASLTMLLACSCVLARTLQSLGIVIGNGFDKKSRLTSNVGALCYCATFYFCVAEYFKASGAPP